MAKQNQKKEVPKQKHPASAQGNSLKYYVHNALIIGVMTFVFSIAYNLNAARGELHDLYDEYDNLKKNDASDPKLDEVGRRIKEIETDTSYFKVLTLGYFEEVHFVPVMYKQMESLRASVNNGNVEGPVTREDKLNYKISVYPLLDYVNANTPKNAVVLLPPVDSLAYNSKWNYLYDPIWVEYFIYPRLCLTSGREFEHPDLAKRITHVLIVKGIGYDKLKYDVPLDKREKVAVLPIEKPDTLQTSQ
jgi:hypothetical protein